MGGNALKNVTTRRYAAGEYHQLELEVLCKLEEAFPKCIMSAIQSYAEKASFGDMDILISSEHIPRDYRVTINKLFQPSETVSNGNCYSFEYKQLQIDLIVTKPNEYESSIHYFAYNDLGNLLGRIAHSLGFKLGHDGLTYNFRDGTNLFANIPVTQQWPDILSLLGLSPKKYYAGFDTLEDIYNFTADSPYFCKEIFALENRNHAARVRDEKRSTYTGFLEYIKDRQYDDQSEFSMEQVFDIFPEFYERLLEVEKEYAASKEFKTRYNGLLVSEVTGLQGKELGLFMKWVKEYFAGSLVNVINALNPIVIERFVAHMYLVYTNNLQVVKLDIVYANE